jgi:hypothetical protein
MGKKDQYLVKAIIDRKDEILPNGNIFIKVR